MGLVLEVPAHNFQRPEASRALAADDRWPVAAGALAARSTDSEALKLLKK